MSVSRRKRWRVLDRDNYTCVYCGRKSPDVALEVDHVEPRSTGGSDDIANLVTACFDCNQGKKAKDSLNGLVGKDWITRLREDQERATRTIEILVCALATERQDTEGDVWDWLLNEVDG